jgi:hypothetical protein
MSTIVRAMTRMYRRNQSGYLIDHLRCSLDSLFGCTDENHSDDSFKYDLYKRCVLEWADETITSTKYVIELLSLMIRMSIENIPEEVFSGERLFTEGLRNIQVVDDVEDGYDGDDHNLVISKLVMLFDSVLGTRDSLYDSKIVEGWRECRISKGWRLAKLDTAGEVMVKLEELYNRI